MSSEAMQGTEATQGGRPSTPLPHTPRLALKDVVLMVTFGVVFGFLYWVFVQAWNGLSVLMGPAGDLAQHVLLGAWLLAAPVAVAVIRRPLVGVIAEVIAAVIEVFFLGSPVGPLLLIAAALQGIGSELPFALGRYRRFGWARFAASGAAGAALVFVFTAFRDAWWGTDLFTIRLLVQVASGVVLGGLLAKVLVDALARTGAVDGFDIGRASGILPGKYERRAR
jgi:energy-coupling factor transport system substrate-specific component